MIAPDTDAARQLPCRPLAGALARPFWIDGQVVQVGATTGLAHAPRDGRQPRRADAPRRPRAARRPSASSAASRARFEPAMDVEFDDRRFLERELQARDRGEGARRPLPADRRRPTAPASSASRRCCAGPIRRAARSRRACSCRSPSRCGLMATLGEFVLRRALADARRWPDLYIAVNLSPVQVRDPALVDLVRRAAGREPASRRRG